MKVDIDVAALVRELQKEQELCFWMESEDFAHGYKIGLQEAVIRLKGLEAKHYEG